MLIWILIGIVAFILIIFVIGLLLPKERVVSKQTIYNAAPEVVFNIVTNNADWQYRSDLKDLKIVSTDGNKQVWDEYSKDGQVIRFSTLQFIPYTYYSFSMESKMFYGHWTSTYEETADGKTLYTATEYITMRNPLTRLLNYLFFDIGKYMEGQQNDIRGKLNSL